MATAVTMEQPGPGPRGAPAPAPASRPRRRRRPEPALPATAVSWAESPEGVSSHARALDDLSSGRLQWFDHAAFMAAWGASASSPVPVEWAATDEFTRRYERLRGRSQRAFAAALEAFVEDMRRAGGSRPRFRAALAVRRAQLEDGDAWVMSWSSEGRATFQIERDPAVASAHRVIWLTIGPHGSPTRKRGRRS